MTLTLVPEITEATEAVAAEARRGLTAERKSLPPWLFYDEAGSRLFEEITALPEYYLTRIEREIFKANAEEIFEMLGANLTVVELGAGTAAKTGILLRALSRRQMRLLYQPIDISPTALDEARESIERIVPGVTVRPRIANYIAESIRIERPRGAKVLALYIGSSIGNFSPGEAREILGRLRSELEAGDALLLGTDLAPSVSPNGARGEGKSMRTLLAAYDDAAGVTAAFNRNILVRLNRELGTNFCPEQFAHRALWNAEESRIEMHLKSLCAQRVSLPADGAGRAETVEFAAGETIHTENSYKFTRDAINELLGDSGFAPVREFSDAAEMFAVTLAEAV
jgi:dimethylhistidine N-methyltransferase